LAGNAFGRDKKGRVKKDDVTDMHALGEAASAAEYTPYVYYEFSFD
jgi:V-type H+-transporting ATPase subunit C